MLQYWVVSMSRNLICFNNHPCCTMNKWGCLSTTSYSIFFLVNTGLATTTVRFPSLILRCTIHWSPGLDWLRSTDRGLDHSLGKLEPSGDRVVFSGWLADRIPSLDVRIQREWQVWQNHPRWQWPVEFQFLRFKTRRERRQPASNYKPSLLAPRGPVGVTHPRRRQLLRLYGRLLCVLL